MKLTKRVIDELEIRYWKPGVNGGEPSGPFVPLPLDGLGAETVNLYLVRGAELENLKRWLRTLIDDPER